MSIHSIRAIVIATAAVTSLACGAAGESFDPSESVGAEESLGSTQQELSAGNFSPWSEICCGEFETGFAVTSRTTNQLDVFGRGLGNTFWYNGWSAQDGWRNWEEFSSRTFDSKPAAARWKPTTQNYYNLAVAGRESDGTIFVKVSSGSNPTWSSWSQIKTTTFDSAPALAFDSTYLIMVARRSDAQLWWTKNDVRNGYSAANWTDWKAIAGGTVKSEPALATSTPTGGTVYLVARGMDDHYWRTKLSGGSWTGYSQIPAGTWDTAPALSVWGGTSFQVFGRKTNGRMAYTTSSSSSQTTWTTPTELSSYFDLKPPAAWSYASGHIDVLALGTEGEPFITTYQQ